MTDPQTHEPGCPAIADDESDYEHLDDAGTCACSPTVRALRAEVTRLTQERDQLLLDRHQPGRVLPCGHYRVFAMPAVHEDGSESPCCMQCDRDSLHIRVEQAEADLLLCQQERDQLLHEAATCMDFNSVHVVAAELHRLRQGIAPVVEAMQTVERVAGQRSVDGPYDTLALIAAVEAKLAAQWADTLARLLVPKEDEEKS